MSSGACRHWWRNDEPFQLDKSVLQSALGISCCIGAGISVPAHAAINFIGYVPQAFDSAAVRSLSFNAPAATQAAI